VDVGEYGEPSNAELGRGIAEVKAIVQGLVGRAEYTADQRATDYRLRSIERDVQDNHRAAMTALDREADERAKGDDAISTRISEEAQAGSQHRMHVRELLIMGAIPAAVTLLVGLLSLWVATHGGK
jgi:hypothetical protein